MNVAVVGNGMELLEHGMRGRDAFVRRLLIQQICPSDLRAHSA